MGPNATLLTPSGKYLSQLATHSSILVMPILSHVLLGSYIGDVDEGDVSVTALVEGWTADAGADADNASRSNPVETTEVEGR